MHKTMWTIKQPEYDRTVYLFLDDQEKIIGINFHQGLDEMKEYQEPNKALWEIFENCLLKQYPVLQCITETCTWGIIWFDDQDEIDIFEFILNKINK